jgi:hypothetical protein
MSDFSFVDPDSQSSKITGPGDLLNLDFVGGPE